jgi:hypothetical protein
MTHGKPAFDQQRLDMSDAASAARRMPKQSAILHGAGT